MPHLSRGGGDGTGGIGLRVAAGGIDHRPPTGIQLHPRDDAVHDVDSLVGVLAGGGFARQHHRVGAVEHRRGDVGRFGTGGRGGGDHAFQHLRRHHHGFAELAGQPHNALLCQGDFFGR